MEKEMMKDKKGGKEHAKDKAMDKTKSIINGQVKKDCMVKNEFTKPK